MLTHQQQRFFDFLCDYIEKEGYPPTYAELAKHFNFSSEGTVRTYYEHLEKKGYIQRLGKARGIKILKSRQKGVPIVGQIAAGSPILAEENILGTLSDVSELSENTGRFALKVKGDSMVNAGILNGDLAIIQPGVHINSGQIGAISIDGEATLKTIIFHKDTVELRPQNDAYESIFITPRHLDIYIIGRMIAVVRQA